MPFVESSITIHSDCFVLANCAAFSKISGCGFDAFKVAPLIFALKNESNLNRVNTFSIVLFDAEDAKTKVKPLL